MNTHTPLLDLVEKERKHIPFENLYTREQIEVSLKKSGGWLAFAAKDLKISLSALERIIATKYPSLQEVIYECVETYTDLAENVMVTKIKNGNFEAAKFWLKCRGKKRGWTEIADNTDGQNQSVTIKIESANPVISVNTEQNKEEKIVNADFKVTEEKKPDLNEVFEELKHKT